MAAVGAAAAAAIDAAAAAAVGAAAAAGVGAAAAAAGGSLLAQIGHMSHPILLLISSRKSAGPPARAAIRPTAIVP